MDRNVGARSNNVHSVHSSYRDSLKKALVVRPRVGESKYNTSVCRFHMFHICETYMFSGLVQIKMT